MQLSPRDAKILRRFENVLAKNPARPLRISELCKAFGVTPRIMRRICVRALGMNPLRYIYLRRMNGVRVALLRANPTKSNVAEIASRYGFSELGRFAVQYRKMLGEMPSATLRRPQSRSSSLTRWHRSGASADLLTVPSPLLARGDGVTE